jgi:hypothetical protein
MSKRHSEYVDKAKTKRYVDQMFSSCNVRRWSSQYLGRFFKGKPISCGKTRCQLCHPYKYPKGVKTKAETRADKELKETS